MAKSRKRARVPVDPEQWSEKSKGSPSYYFARVLPECKEYRDIRYSCWRCNAAAIFTAEEQRVAFEVKKAYIWQRRVLCGPCWRERLVIERALRGCRLSWQAKRRELRGDMAFLANWLHLLEELPRYAGRRDSAAIAMLRRLTHGSTMP